MSFRDIDPEALGFATKAMRGGKWYDELCGALNVPIYTSNSYRFESVKDGADPVSYTHLDVYKRQFSICCQISGWIFFRCGVIRRLPLPWARLKCRFFLCNGV